MSSSISFELLPVSTAALFADALKGISLYMQDHESKRVTLYRDAELPITDGDITRLRGRGVAWLYIDKNASHEFHRNLRTVAFSEKEMPIPRRVAAVTHVTRNSIEIAFKTNETENIAATTLALSEVMTDVICAVDFDFQDLFPVLHHDFGTFTHSTNVACYAGILADRLGYSKDDVQQILRGGLLHDLGKLDVDEKILTKPGKLDDKEYQVIKRHPIDGFSRLANRNDLSHGQIMMVYQHHERLDGAGYPVGLKSEDIHPWAKICSIVDVYEALTSQRPYRNAMQPREALHLMYHEVGTAFEKESLECWKSIIQESFLK
jgi:putative nucleotidyltransferase with HDIG domain